MKGNRKLFGEVEIFRFEFSLLHANRDGGKETADGSANANAYDKGNQWLLLSHYCKYTFFLSISLSCCYAIIWPLILNRGKFVTYRLFYC